MLRAAWAGGEISFAGDHVAFEHVVVTAEPVHVPLILGGNTEPALRRAATTADGWFSSGNPTFDEAVRLRARLGELADEVGRERAAAGVRADGRARPGRARSLRRARLRARDGVGEPAVARRRASWPTSRNGSPQPRLSCWTDGEEVGMSGVVITGLTKRFEGKPPTVAVDDFSLSISPGQLVVLLGPSGCGKTTLLRCIAGSSIRTPAASRSTASASSTRPKDQARAGQSRRQHDVPVVRAVAAHDGLQERRVPVKSGGET